MDLSGYLLEPLREASASTLYRGRRVNSISILVLVPAAGEFGAECARRLEQEFALAELLDSAWATKPIALAQHEGRRVLVLDDSGGQPLGELLGKSLEIKRFLTIAINLVTALGHAHGCGLVHKDIKPANVLVDEAANVRLTGFAFATRLPRERQAPSPPDTIAGTLAYMAPEQTGRMNRSIDARSDLYSLGVTLYEMLTGELPFVAMDPMELIHCHIARKPAPPSEHAPDVPAPLGAIVLKLLSKTAEDRYQTAAGVTHDLQRCLSDWNLRTRLEAFPLGAQDHSGRLTVPETLYGREREIEALLAAFQRVITQGTTEFVVVAGPSGVGKSSIVNELHKELILTRGLFGAGKFDSQRPDVPYATLTQALRQVVQQLLNRSDAELGQWRRALVDALGLNAKLIVDLVPQLSLIVGEQPFVPEVPPQDRQVRFQQVFRRFIGVFAQPKHPLVLFLDDLQWIDPATLDLLERLTNDRSFRNVLFVGAYRQTELYPEHRLVRTLKRLTDAGVLQEVQLGPLTNFDVRNLVADALRSESTAASPLADLVFEKTEGNPFFAIQFLTMLEDKGHLSFDGLTRSWRWDIERIRSDSITDQVAELMATKLGRYEDVTRQLIMQLACLGSSARTTTLVSVLRLPVEQVDFAFREPVHAGLIRQLEGGYAFAHDRVQEAAYALIPPADRAQAHLQIGRVLASNIREAELEDNIFEIVTQFNRGTDLISDRAERMQLAKFNLVAGNRARASTAYESALIYFVAGQSLLHEDAAARESQLSFDMNLHRAECELWTGDLISAEARLVKLSLGAATLRDLARVVWVAVALYFKMDRNDQAVEMCLEYLRRVGINWSQHPTDDDVQREYEELFFQLSRRPVETLTDLPPMSDPSDRTTMNVLAALQTSAFYSDRNLWLLLLGRMTNLSLVNGNCEDSTLAYSLVGLVLGPRFGQYRTGLRLGRLAFDLVETGGFERFKPRVYANFASGSMPWTTALRDCVAPNRRAIEAALGAGDRIYAVWSRTQLIANLLACGVPLVEVRTEAEDALRYAKSASFGYLADILTAQLKLVLALEGATQAPSSLADGLDEQSTEGYLQTDPPGSVRVIRYWTRKLQGSFLANDCSSALSAAAKARAGLSTTPLYFERAEYHLYEALALASWLTPLPEPTRSREFAELVDHHDLLAAWAEACPENFADRSTMVAAEIARLEGRELDAEHLYDRAVRAARDQGFIQNEAIAYELAARFHTARGLKTIGDDCLRSARSCFARWGAHGKVRQLNQLYPHLNDEPSPARGSIRESELQELDLAAVVEMSQTIAGEIVLDRLIERLMTVVLRQAGAVRGLLLLPRDGEMRIVSRAVTGRGSIAVELLDMPRLAEELPVSLLQYVARSFENVVLDDASRQNEYSADPYILAKMPRSIWCMPLVNQNRLAGVLYLENNLAAFAFSRGQRTAIHILASQAAISLENANLYFDLHQSQEQARRAEREFRRSFDSIPALAWSAQPDGTPDFFNKQWYAYTGISAEEAPVRWIRAFHPDEVQQVAGKWAQIVRAGVSGEIEARICRPNGDARFFLIRTTPIRDEKGAIVKWYGTATDIEDLKRAEQASREAQAQLAHINRVATMGQLTASIAHEVNQPIAATVANAQAALRWLEKDPPNLGEVRQSLDDIVSSGNRAGDVVARIRALVKNAAPQTDHLDMNEAIREVIALTRSEAVKNRVALQVQFAERLPSIEGDRVQLQQVMLNLIINAIEAIGAIHEGSRELLISTGRAEAGGVFVAVRDSGAGLSPQDLEHVFDAFYTTKSGGMGMGLAICRSIIEAHGGRVWATPNTPRGATFQFNVPASPPTGLKE